MASLTTIHPDIVYEILNYLRRKDVISLLQTCKSLYGPCYRYLWTVLIFNESHDFGNCYPGRLIRSNHSTFKNLLKLIHEGNPLGFEHTKVLWLGRPIFDSDFKAVTWILRRHIKRLLERGELDLREVMVYYSHEVLSASNNPQKARDGDWMVPLHALHKYTKSKSIRDFSLKVKASTIKSFETYFRAELITHFEVFLSSNKVRDPEMTIGHTSTIGNGPIEDNIAKFREVMRGMINLQWFKSRAPKERVSLPPYATVSKELGELQAVFSGLKKLREISLEGYVFHPTFFLVPPANVKKLSIYGTMSPVWWEIFAAAPLTNVEDLSLTTRWGQSSDIPHVQFEPVTDKEAFLIRDVACRGLKKLTIQNEDWMPRDLEACILRRNPNLDNSSSREVAIQKVTGLLNESNIILRTRSRLSASTLRSRVPRHILESSGENPIAVDIGQAFSEAFDTGHYKGTSMEDLKTSIESWETFGGVAGSSHYGGIKNRLRDHLENCMQMVLDKYIHKYGNFPPPGKDHEFFNDCIKSFGSMDEIQEWTKRKREAQRSLGRCEHKIVEDTDQQQSIMTEELADRLSAGEVLNKEDIMAEWKRRLVEGFEQFGLEEEN
ncbi:hypothetical protein TWF506_005368 [Arthrobotrys conoides]|uniref:F-box domain-containing protein n=1 Tax=Arthrobotrys conoides TaxID=74498 RepID=A0AAN8NE27_9PEZI